MGFIYYGKSGTLHNKEFQIRSEDNKSKQNLKIESHMQSHQTLTKFLIVDSIQCLEQKFYQAQKLDQRVTTNRNSDLSFNATSP